MSLKKLNEDLVQTHKTKIRLIRPNKLLRPLIKPGQKKEEIIAKRASLKKD